MAITYAAPDFKLKKKKKEEDKIVVKFWILFFLFQSLSRKIFWAVYVVNLAACQLSEQVHVNAKKIHSDLKK